MADADPVMKSVQPQASGGSTYYRLPISNCRVANRAIGDRHLKIRNGLGHSLPRGGTDLNRSESLSDIWLEKFGSLRRREPDAESLSTPLVKWEFTSGVYRRRRG